MGVKGGDGRAGRADLTEGRLLGIPTPSPLSVGGNVTPASLQASVLPVYWLFYTVKLNKAELRSCKHLRTYVTFSKSELATFISCESTWVCFWPKTGVRGGTKLNYRVVFIHMCGVAVKKITLPPTGRACIV